MLIWRFLPLSIPCTGINPRSLFWSVLKSSKPHSSPCDSAIERDDYHYRGRDHSYGHGHDGCLGHRDHDHCTVPNTESTIFDQSIIYTSASRSIEQDVIIMPADFVQYRGISYSHPSC